MKYIPIVLKWKDQEKFLPLPLHDEQIQHHCLPNP